MKKINLHNHTTFSDGDNTPEEIIRFAIKHNFNEIAITDHYKLNVDYAVNQTSIDNYVEIIQKLKKKYKQKIKVLIGIEAAPKHLTPFSYLVRADLDFVLIHHFLGLKHFKIIKEFRKVFKKPLGFAHLDLDSLDIPLPILKKFILENDLFIELNTGKTSYETFKPYFESYGGYITLLKDKKIKISIGTDTHSDLEDVGDISSAEKFIKKHNLRTQLIKI